MTIKKDIAELLALGILNAETAQQIRMYYDGKQKQSNNKVFIVFGILGALLIGLGLVLIIAHNWMWMSKEVKLFFALLPLLLSQLLGGFVIFKKREAVLWRETSAVLLFFAIGSAISLVSQIYNVSGNIGAFTLVWMLLSLPVFYLLRSFTVLMMYIVGITFFAMDAHGLAFPEYQSYYYLPLLLAAFPYYLSLYKEKHSDKYLIFIEFLLALSLTISISTLVKNSSEIIYITYFSLFGFMYMLGDLHFNGKQAWHLKAYRIWGFIGTMVMLYMLSFVWFWDDLASADFSLTEQLVLPDFLMSVFLFIMTGLLFLYYLKKGKLYYFQGIAIVFILFVGVFFLGLYAAFSVVLINMIILLIGMAYVVEGGRKDQLLMFNLGLVIVSILVISRFFDTQMSFVLRGIAFVVLGIGLFGANYWMLRKRGHDEK